MAKSKSIKTPLQNFLGMAEVEENDCSNEAKNVQQLKHLITRCIRSDLFFFFLLGSTR